MRKFFQNTFVIARRILKAGSEKKILQILNQEVRNTRKCPRMQLVRSGVLTYKTYHHFNKIPEFHTIVTELMFSIICPLKAVQQQETHPSFLRWGVSSTDFSQRHHKILTIKSWLTPNFHQAILCPVRDHCNMNVLNSCCPDSFCFFFGSTSCIS